MPRSVTVNANDVEIDGKVVDNGATVVVSDAEFAALTAAGRFSGGSPLLTDNGAADDPDDNDQVSVQGATVAAPTAITSVVAAGANPTKAEYDALRTDVVNLRTTVANLLTSIKGSGKAVSPT